MHQLCFLLGGLVSCVIFAIEGNKPDALLSIAGALAAGSFIPLAVEYVANSMPRRLQNRALPIQTDGSFRLPPLEPPGPSVSSDDRSPRLPTPGDLRAAVTLEIPREVESAIQIR